MPPRRNVLLLEDDRMLRASLAEQLARESTYAVVEADTCEDASSKVRERAYEFLILDVGLPDGDGRTLARRLRQEGVSAPIVLLASDEEEGRNASDIVLADYVVKPFRYAFLMARVHALLRRHDNRGTAEARIGPFRFHPTAKLLEDEMGRKVRLTEKETAILLFLSRSEASVSRETLLHEVWGYSPLATTHTLDTHVYRLRRKLEADGRADRILVSENGGYRLTGTIRT